MRKMKDSGVDFLLGSDAPQVFNVPGFSIQHEMKAMINAGFSPFEVLESGTINPARFFGKENEFGKISVGNSADLILTENNPLEDISAMSNPLGVMVKGKWLSRDIIDKRLLEIEEKYKSEEQ